jgi:Cys-tRNA(Pro)/Cys-tRNA(Cys) deacylase
VLPRTGKATRATLEVARAEVPHVVHAYEAGPGAYGPAAAAALGVPEERMLKTLVVDLDGRLVCAVVPVAGSLDLKLLAAALGGKRAAMAETAAAERATGYVVGGISPLGQRTRLPAAVDATVLQHDSVLVSAGRRGLSLELPPAELVRLTGAVVAHLLRTT